MESKVSFIVPIYNQEENVRRLYQSILDQNVKNYEIIFVNDGSRDGTLSKLEALAKIDGNIIIITQPNGGLSSARNSGLSKASGKYIIFIDGDDFYIKAGVMAKVVNSMEEQNADLGFFGYAMVDMNGNILRSKKIDTNLSTMFSGVWNKIYSRRLLNGISFPIGRYFEDIEVSAHIRIQARKIITIRDTVYGYVQRPDSIVKKIDSNKHADAFFLINHLVTSKWVNELQGELVNEVAQYSISQLFNHSIVISQYDDISQETKQLWNLSVLSLQKYSNNVSVSFLSKLKLKLASDLCKQDSKVAYILSTLGNFYRNHFVR